MELRQLRYFVRIVETGSMGSAALDLNIGVSALSQQMSRLENELAIRLLQRTSLSEAAICSMWKVAMDTFFGSPISPGPKAGHGSASHRCRRVAGVHRSRLRSLRAH